MYSGVSGAEPEIFGARPKILGVKFGATGFCAGNQISDLFVLFFEFLPNPTSNPRNLTKIGKVCSNRKVDQALRHQIHGSKPTKTHSIHRSVERQYGAIFVEIFEINGGEENFRGESRSTLALIPVDKAPSA